MAVQCWEFKECGREQGGKLVAEMGLCPAAEAQEHDGLNSGKNGGRICWAITGTFCGGVVQGTHAQKISNCLVCDFFKQTKAEEGKGFHLMLPGQTYQPATG